MLLDLLGNLEIITIMNNSDPVAEVMPHCLKDIKILGSALVANVLPQEDREKIVTLLANKSAARDIVKGFGNSQLIREINLVRDRSKEELPILQVKDNKIFYGNQEIGEQIILYKSPLPGELQARLSYESISDRFLEYLRKVHHVIVLNESIFHVQVFIPNIKKIDFTEEWNKFITEVAFSIYGYPKHQLPGLLNTFVLLLNTIKLAVPEEPYKGFGVPELPIITKEQANLLAAWYYAILYNLLTQNKISDEHKKQFFGIETKYNQKILIIKKLSKQFRDFALQQIGITQQRIPKLIEQLEYLINLDKFDFKPKPILTKDIIYFAYRKAGDDNNSNFCYSCGVNFINKEKNYDAIKFIFQSSNQRLQSSNNEKQPKICSTCMSIAIASPLKLSHRNIILELSVSKQNNHSLKIYDYLRMLTNKEINIFSGKYILIPSEYIKKKHKVFVSQKLGQIQYALLKTAAIFPLEVLEDFKFNLILQGNQAKELSNSYLILIKGLIDNYGQKIIADGEINLRLGDAVRYVEQDSPYLAEYTIVKCCKVSKPLNMEQVRYKYWNTLKGDNDVNSKRKKLYEDVAALTGLTYAFAKSLESTARSAMKPEDVGREVSKLIEQVNDPFSFCYYATLGDEKKTSVQARLYSNPDNIFMYEQTVDLLKKLNISPQEREVKDKDGKKYLTLYADDINRAYTYFSDESRENNYSQDKDWNELTYNLKLSLYTRFPELVRKLNKKGDK
ncbi:hypothetical protein NIES4102_19120 [Chondrocystis sp. NIES-4102]|nr:hypothetical protein NIES4102_19120 [Chondrocystis sp. NIES-4102]